VRWRVTIAGLAATCATTAIAAIAHVLVYRIAFPPEAIAQNAVGVTSGRIDSFFIQLLGHWAERLTVIGLSIGFALSGAVLAHLFPKRLLSRTAAWAVVPIPLWAFAVAVYSAPEPFLSRWEFAVASLPIFLVGGLIGGQTLARIQSSTQPLHGPAAPASVDSPLNPHVTRRSLLAALGAGTVGVAIGSSRLATLLSGGSDTGAVRLRTTTVVRAKVPPPAPGDAAFAHIAGLTQEVTPTEDFYVVDKDILNPVIDQSSWRLRVHGLVDNAFSLGYSGLRSMQAYERYQTLECISNKVGGQLMSTALWTGVRLGDILDRAGVKPGARTVVFRAAGGYSESHSLEKAMDPTTLIAIGMNRHELPRVHGFPARLLTVGTYGMKNPKWLTDIELIDGDYRGYWEIRGWSPDQDPKITTRIDVPEDGSKVGASTVIGGIAFAGDRGISRVQVSADGGHSWEDARLKTALSPYTWRLWMYEWRPPRPGGYRILARAFDGSGRVQTSTPASPFPSGAAGLDGITLEAS
jgi:DMSO/TMAO reductase YedYZ molybdopterin-dependent catalytic subunit